MKLGDHNTLNGLLKSPSKSNGVADKQKGMSKFKLDSKPGLYSSTKTLLDKDKGKKNSSNHSDLQYSADIAEFLANFLRRIVKKMGQKLILG